MAYIAPMGGRQGLLVVAALSCASMALACAPHASAQHFTPTAPWTDGETSNYDVPDAPGAVVGVASFTWHKNGTAWTESYERSTRMTMEKGTVELDEQLRPRRAHVEGEGPTIDLTYGENMITVHTVRGTEPAVERSFPRPATAVDNEACLELQRGLAFAAGFATAYDDVVPNGGSVATMEVRVLREESITVPAGTFAAWHVRMSAAGYHDAWYAKDAPHLMLRYDNSGRTVYLLRSWQTSTTGELHGSREPAPVPGGKPSPVRPLLLVMAFGVQLPLMLLMPIAVGIWIARRLGASWRLWAMGAMTFILSQVVHVPLQFGVMGVAPALRQSVPLLALVSGLSAGLCEEVARYVMLRYGLPKARSFGDAVMFGAGHGGIEAMFIGLVAVLQFAAMFAQRWLPPGSLGPELERLGAAQDAYWSYAWYMPALSGLERVSTMISHVAMTLMVMLAVVRGRAGWLLAAIGVHAAVDGFAVWGLTNFGVVGTEAGIAVFGIALAVFIARAAGSERGIRATSPTGTA